MSTVVNQGRTINFVKAKILGSMIHSFFLYHHDALAIIDDYTVFIFILTYFFIAEASVAERLTPRTPDLDWRTRVHPEVKYTIYQNSRTDKSVRIGPIQ